MARMRSWIKRLYAREGFRGPVVTLLSGTAVTLVVSYLTVPILTRLFTPEQFGISDYFSMMISVLMTVASLRYEDAIMLPEDEDKAASLFWLSIVLTLATTVLVAIASIYSNEITSFLRVEGLAPWLWLLAPTLFFMQFGRMSELWLSRKKLFQRITGGEVINKLSMVSSRVGAGLGTNLGAGGLIGGFAAAYLASGVYYGAVLWNHAQSLFRRRLSPSRFREAAVRYRRFLLYGTPSSVLNAVVARLPVLLLPVYFGMEPVGLFGRAFMALAVPMSLVGSAVSQVFFVHAAEAHREGRLHELTETVHARLIMLGMFPMVLLIFVGPDLFAFVFGSTWRTAGIYEQYLAVWFFAGGVASPLTRLFDVLERQRTELLISIVTCLALTSALVYAGHTRDVLLAMALISLAGTSVRALQIGTMMKLAGVPLRAAIRPYLRYGLLSLPLALPVLLTQRIFPLWATALSAAFFGACYFGIVLWREKLLPGISAD